VRPISHLESATVKLTELERDALTELANIAVGRAAASLSVMVSEPIHLSVPAVGLLTREEAGGELESRENGNLIAVQQHFSGSFSGRALLLFPETNSLELIRAVLGPQPSLEEIADLEQEALSEVGNVILNAYLATIANLLRQRIEISLPELRRGPGRQILNGADTPTELNEFVLFLYIDFVVGRHGIRGYIAVLMNFPSLEALTHLTKDFVDRMTGEAASDDGM
jgi:chemotaxis protein CheC